MKDKQQPDTAATLAREFGVSPSTIRRLDPQVQPPKLPDGTRLYGDREKRIARALLDARKP